MNDYDDWDYPEDGDAPAPEPRRPTAQAQIDANVRDAQRRLAWELSKDVARHIYEMLPTVPGVIGFSTQVNQNFVDVEAWDSPYRRRVPTIRYHTATLLAWADNCPFVEGLTRSRLMDERISLERLGTPGEWLLSQMTMRDSDTLELTFQLTNPPY